MSVPIAGRCGALAALMAISFSCAVAQQKMPCPKDWQGPPGAIVDDISGCCSDLADLVTRVEIIVSGEVTDCNVRVSRAEVWTDYTINIQEIYKQPEKSSFAPGAKIQVSRREVGSPALPQGMPEIFFIGPCNAPDCTTGYGFPVGSLGAISLENGQVSCSARPDAFWKPYCGITASSFISTLKQKVASGDFIYKYYTWTSLQGTLIERKVNGASEDGETPSKDGQDNILVLRLTHPITVEPRADVKDDIGLEVARDIREVSCRCSLIASRAQSCEGLVGQAVVATGAFKKTVAPSQNTKVWFDITFIRAK